MPLPGDRSIADVLESVLAKLQSIIRCEVQLAKAEVRQEAAKAGKAAAILGTGALLAVYAGGLLLMTCVWALELVMAAWLAGLIVTVVAGCAAFTAIRAGRKRLGQIDPKPNRTIHSVQENVEWLKNQTR